MSRRIQTWHHMPKFWYASHAKGKDQMTNNQNILIVSPNQLDSSQLALSPWSTCVSPSWCYVWCTFISSPYISWTESLSATLPLTLESHLQCLDTYLDAALSNTNARLPLTMTSTFMPKTQQPLERCWGIVRRRDEPWWMVKMTSSIGMTLTHCADEPGLVEAEQNTACRKRFGRIIYSAAYAKNTKKLWRTETRF